MSETLTADGQVRTYRGSSIEALLPQIRGELGPDAVIVRQREGLIGGVGGFFQKRCVEVEARPGGPGIDVYDEAPEGLESFDEADAPRVLSQEEGGAAGEGVLGPPPPLPPAADSDSACARPLVRNDAATREGLATPAVRKLVEQTEPFAEMLGELSGPEAGEEPEPEPVSAPRRATVLREAMAAAGLGEDIAREVIDAVLASQLPFANPGRLRTLVRNELSLRVPVAPAAAPGPHRLAVVGPAGAGKTTAVARIAAAHAAAGKDVSCVALEASDGGAGLEAMLAGSGARVLALGLAGLAAGPPPGLGDGGRPGMLLIDSPPSRTGSETLGELAAALAAAQLDEVHLVLRAGTAAPAGAELLEALAPLRPSRLLATGAGETSHVGGLLDVAIRADLPLGYVADGPEAIAPADARALVRRMTP